MTSSDETPPLSPSSTILQQAQRRNERRHEQRRKRIQARFNSELPELLLDLERVKENCGQYAPHEVASFGCVGFSEMQGRRPSMEDAHSLHLAFHEFLTLENGETPYAGDEVFLGIYDGHGGADAAKYTQERLHLIFASKIKKYHKLRQSLSNLVRRKEEFTRLYLESTSTTADPSTPLDSSTQALLQTILAEITALKFHFTELVKRVSYQLRAPEIEHVIEEEEDDDSSEGWDSDEDAEDSSTSHEDSRDDAKNDNILVEDSLEPLQLEMYSEEDAIQLLLRESFLEVNDEMKDRKVPNGCTASVVYMNRERAYTANVGDSRIVLCRNDKPIRLSVDHRPSDPAEKERIRNVGGYVNGGRVNGILAVTRALGDCFLEPMVTADPTTTYIDLNLAGVTQKPQTGDNAFNRQDELQTGDMTQQQDLPQDSPDNFLIVACDGLWDFVSDEKAIEIAQEDQDPRIAAVRLRNFSYQTGSSDNISVCVFRFADGTRLLEEAKQEKSTECSAPEQGAVSDLALDETQSLGEPLPQESTKCDDVEAV